MSPGRDFGGFQEYVVLEASSPLDGGAFVCLAAAEAAATKLTAGRGCGGGGEAAAVHVRSWGWGAGEGSKSHFGGWTGATLDGRAERNDVGS